MAARRPEPHAPSPSALLLRAATLTRRFGGLAAVDARLARPARRRGARGDRHQRRRQVDADQHAVGRDAAPATAASSFDGHDITRLVAAAARARRHRPQLPAHHDLPEVQRARELPPRARRRARRAPGRCGSAAAALRRTAPTRAATALAAGRARRRRRRAAPARSATAASASSRSRCAWRRGRACCCSTSRSPAWAPRRPSRMLALLADAEARATRSCSSSTTWTRCSASPTASP